jgi:hypothetical protein
MDKRISYLRGLNRRTFFKIVMWIVAFAIVALLVDLFRREYQPSTRLRRRLRARAKRKRFRSQTISSASNMVMNHRGTGIIHWPHPKIFKYREEALLAKGTRFAVSEWKSKIGIAIPSKKKRKPSRAGKSRFERRREPTIRETLALSNLSVDIQTLEFRNVSLALDILRPALKVDYSEPKRRSTCNGSIRIKQASRSFVLYARLLCLQFENDASQAYNVLTAQLKRQSSTAMALKKRGTQDLDPLDIPSRVPWAHMSFGDWHSKTIMRHSKHRVFRARLAKRVLSAQEIAGVKAVQISRDSSSGQDTFRGEGSSNLPSRDSRFMGKRRSWLARKKKWLRQKRKLLGNRFRCAAERTTRPTRSSKERQG